jgi:hypothetical protein
VISFTPIEKTGDPLDAADNGRARETSMRASPLIDDSGGAQRSAVAAFRMRRTLTI